jgi:hypothetical protein
MACSVSAIVVVFDTRGAAESEAMAHWYYRTTDEMSLEDTQRILSDFGFIARTAYVRQKTGRIAPVTKVREVGLGDVLHVYHVSGDGAESLGTWEICGPRRHGRGECMGPAVTKTAVHRAKGDLLSEMETNDEVHPDPSVEAYTGWFVLAADERSPDYQPGWFTGRAPLAPAH